MLTLTQRETAFVMQKNSRGEGRCRILIRKTKAQICAKRSISELPITICDTSGDRRRNLRFSGQPTNDNEGKTPTMEFYLIVTMRPALCTEGWRRCHRVLKNEKKLFKRATYDHNYPHCWRTDTPIIYRAMQSWYVRVTDLTDRLLKIQHHKTASNMQQH